jgi:hypothetical protein
MCEPLKAVLERLLSAHAEEIASITGTDQEGLWLFPQSLTSQQLVDAIHQDLDCAAWGITSIRRNKILIEPAETELAGWLKDEAHFHVTARNNRSAIEREGLQLRTGGNTIMNRVVTTGRIYLARTLADAFEFVEYQCGDRYDRMDPICRKFDPDAEKVTTRDKLDIWCVRLSKKIIVRRDVLLPGKAGYIQQPITPQFLCRLRCWRASEKLWRFGRHRGWV